MPPNLRQKLDIASSTKVKSYILIKPQKDTREQELQKEPLKFSYFSTVFLCEKMISIYLKWLKKYIKHKFQLVNKILIGK